MEKGKNVLVSCICDQMQMETVYKKGDCQGKKGGYEGSMLEERCTHAIVGDAVLDLQALVMTRC